MRSTGRVSESQKQGPHDQPREVLDLTASAALAASGGPTLGMGHTLFEAQALAGIVLTGRAVNVYDQLKLPVLKI
jgi:hypothetical protein